MSLDVKEVGFDEEQGISNTIEKSRKSQTITEWCKCGKCETFFLKLRFTLRKTEQPLQGMELQEKEVQKD